MNDINCRTLLRWQEHIGSRRHGMLRFNSYDESLTKNNNNTCLSWFFDRYCSSLVCLEMFVQ